MDINILYEDEEVIVCEKPAGVAAQTRRLGQADMERFPPPCQALLAGCAAAIPATAVSCRTGRAT